MIKHTIAPIYDKNSRILILGSFPSVKSREQQFFYGHKQNRFWKVLAGILGYEVPQTIEEKKEMLLANHIAVWDVIQSCEIEGSSDASIHEVIRMICRKFLRRQISGQFIQMVEKLLNCMINTFTR